MQKTRVHSIRKVVPNPESCRVPNTPPGTNFRGIGFRVPGETCRRWSPRYSHHYLVCCFQKTEFVTAGIDDFSSSHQPLHVLRRHGQFPLCFPVLNVRHAPDNFPVAQHVPVNRVVDIKGMGDAKDDQLQTRPNERDRGGGNGDGPGHDEIVEDDQRRRGRQQQVRCSHRLDKPIVRRPDAHHDWHRRCDAEGQQERPAPIAIKQRRNEEPRRRDESLEIH
mmetsp:Transcript_31165/g.87378  ORF Transcript_31165/g.87378 Transcript_31165/m.87378 type:complete len:221 (+) Transcript_31165:210-872(+)